MAKKNTNRKSVNLLPAFFRTEKNSKFLSSTLDQLIKIPSIERIDGFVGSKLSKNYNPNTDFYLEEQSYLRKNYALEPSLIVKKENNKIKKTLGIDDLVNQISYYSGKASNFDKLFRPRFNSYNPHIDWDKFVNFRNYFWLPMGPDTVLVAGLQKEAESTYKVTDDGNFFIFTPDGLTQNPQLELYRGITYTFIIESTHKFYIKTEKVSGTEYQYTESVLGNGTKKIIFTVGDFTPSVLYYTSDDNQIIGGKILIKNILENSTLNVEKEVLGMMNYTSGNGIKFINGLKVKFVGDVTPLEYVDKEFIIEGVGSEIRLVDFSTLINPENLGNIFDDDFDATPFDEYPFDNFRNIPITPEYITIDRSSIDLNPWSRYNRWFHLDVITASANANGVIPIIPLDKRATRPIVQFSPNIQLWNFATKSIAVIDLIDEITTDVFSIVEGSPGYNVDDTLLEDGFKVVFNADPDPLVRGKIFEVSFSIIEGKKKLNLTEIITPDAGSGILVQLGATRTGTEWWFDGTKWNYSQQRITRNQAPLFDLFDKTTVSYSSYVDDFAGNKIFGYAIGTGTPDPVLGFPLKYKNDNEALVGTYLFQNYFNTDDIQIRYLDNITTISNTNSYIKINKDLDRYYYDNIWIKAEEYRIPVIQFQVINSLTSSIEVISFDNPANINDLILSVFIDDKKISPTEYSLSTFDKKLFVDFNTPIDGSSSNKRVLFKIYTDTTPNNNGYYETPLNLTNNPLNGPLDTFTLSEVVDHVKTMTDRDPEFVGDFFGSNNLKDLPNITSYGSRLITNENPLSFSELFIANNDHNLINAIRKTSIDYYQFKLNLIKVFSQTSSTLTSYEALDQALVQVNLNKNSLFPYSNSDMIGYGNNNVSRTYKVTDKRNKLYSISSSFSLSDLSSRSILVYLNNAQLTHGSDYVFENNNVKILRDLVRNDIILIKDYISTVGSYVPPTPTKLGLFPKYKPEIFIDYSYANEPIKVIQGHDGSLTVAFSKYNQPDDYRDILLLEFEKRIYNNIKVEYNPEFINIHDVFPGVFRNSQYTFFEIYNMIYIDFLKWTNTYGLDFVTNSTYDQENFKTYNFKSTQDHLFLETLQGNWRGIYKYYFDTDRPNTHPWEMLGFSEMPSWWEEEYGPAPYTSGNLNLWNDLEEGRIRQGSRAGIDPTYIRPGLKQIIPVDESGDIIDVRQWAGIATNENIPNPDQNWEFGDCGPVETSWRRSSLWPFAVQIVMALSKPADYASYLFDTSRIKKDLTGKYVYGDDQLFLNPKDLLLYTDIDSNGNTILATGYGVWVIEHGKQRVTNYLNSLKNDLKYLDFNLVHKAGGFLSKDKLEIIIDSLSPSTVNPGVLLPNEDYYLHFNTSNSVKSVAISGIIIEKKNGYFYVRGYDKQYPYFTINKPNFLASSSSVTVGGKSETFLEWKENSFYLSGQLVRYNNLFYRVVLTHNSGQSFAVSYDGTVYYALVSSVPIIGGVTVLTTNQYESDETVIPYGIKYTTVQEVYDLIAGYGHWLENKGFIFDEFNQDFGQVLDWSFSGKEFLYWTTQNWADGAVITLSPFSNKIQYRYVDSVVDNLLDSFYDYSLLKADGQVFPIKSTTLNRDDGLFSITTKNIAEGLFFARLNLVQKEHAIVINNFTMFNDTIYDVDSGFRQSRIRLIGFRTAGWNGDFISPGFVYDDAQIENWSPYTDYKVADVVSYIGKYYSANRNLSGTTTFNANDWTLLLEKPESQLLPNFDYKISQFEDFYSLDIDNFDIDQQKLAQHLIGYTPRNYLSNIFLNPIAQYKFYQGFIREKGTRNAIDKLSKASIHNLKGKIEFDEEWAFRIGSYGNFTSFNEIRFPLKENDFRENSQIVRFVDVAPTLPNDLVSYIIPTEVTLKDNNYDSSNVFSTVPFSNQNEVLLLSTAGYVRTDDVTATAYNKNSLLDIANNGLIKEGDTIWLGFRDDGSWDVYRYTKQKVLITSSSVTIPQSEITYQTDFFHNLLPGDIISIYGLDNGTDGVYIVKNVPSLTSFTVSSSLISSSDSMTKGLIFKFVSVRVNNFDDIIKLQNSIKFKNNDLIWADLDSDGKWTVYQKKNNFTSTEYTNVIHQPNQKFGQQLISQDESSLLAVSAPGLVDVVSGHGRIFIYGIDGSTLTPILNYGINSTTDEYLSSSYPTNFGTSLAYDKDLDVVIAGASNASYVKHGGTPSLLVNEGLVKISRFDTTATVVSETVFSVVENPYPQNNSYFGSSLSLSKKNSPYTNNKLLLVGAPGQDNYGAVFPYDISFTTSTCTLSTGSTLTNSISQSLFGTSVSSNSNGTRIAISAPNTDNGKGTVYVYQYEDAGFMLSQTITAPEICKPNDNFGSNVLISDDGTYLFVSSIKVDDSRNSPGKVFVFKFNNDVYELNQTIDNPSRNSYLSFGESITINSQGDTLVVTGKGDASYFDLTFDDNSTTFDGETCNFVDIIKNSGGVFIFNRYIDKFVYAENLFDPNIQENSDFGESTTINSGIVFVGAPNSVNSNKVSGNIYIFSKIDNSINSWNLYRQQEQLVDISKVKRAFTLDTLEEKIVDYLDIIDPVKGYISKLADQELRYKTPFDPAIYSLGNNTIVVDTNANWIDDHIGELWWDLSSIKYVWYEQGDLEYRKNSWGKLFPGVTVDVYEWVRSEYLPSQWAAIADTIEGLSQGISGQPKHPDNSVLSVQQYYNSITGKTSNIYYYWVKNKSTIPDKDFRKISATEVARLIYDISAYGLKYISIISKDAISVTNIGAGLNSNRIHLNIAKDEINNINKRHTEWLLITENSSTSMPNSLLDKKLIDSLLGRDSLGNLVPDSSLPDNMKYGIEIRPRQGMFKNRIEALRNVIEYVNSVFRKYIMINLIEFENLNSKEEIPDIDIGEYDKIVENNEELFSLNLTALKTIQASLSCEVENGKIISVNIDNPGLGYLIAPYVNIVGDESGASIVTEIDSEGKIISATIVNSGNKFEQSPRLDVRPFSIIVQIDADSGNKWSKYWWLNSKWVKIHTQSYDTTQFWDYYDWSTSDYDPSKPLLSTVEEPYLLETLDLPLGSYVKVMNQGNGNYIIVERVSEQGSFNELYNLVYNEKATIQIKDSLWNINKSVYPWDKNSYDQTWFDRDPTIELSNILKALKEDIFVGELKVYWNKMFFKAIKYAMSEQIFLDWAFKTSFINVRNQAGYLDQRPVFKFQDSQYYEQYIEEVKPYRTLIRNFNTVYDILEDPDLVITDFDLPVAYDERSEQFLPVELDNPLMNSYPRKDWYEGYKYSIDRIVVSSGGSGYTTVPTVEIIPAEGDTGYGATAKAFIALGKVIEIEVTNSGSGYTVTPTILINGGGSTELTPAVAYPMLTNDRVRSNLIGLRFDRVSSFREIFDKRVSDSYYCNGSQSEFLLSWAADENKNNIDIKLNGIRILSSNYYISTYKEIFNEYHKLYSKLVLNFVPDRGKILDITYNKNINLYHAVDRIQDYYNPEPGMPGNDPAQLMTGVDYPGTQFETRPFFYSTYWDMMPYNDVGWDDDGISDNDLDTVLDGGDLAYQYATGLNPEDITVDGEQFISPNISHAPEEVIPGEVLESLSVSVYTRNPSGSPLITQTILTYDGSGVVILNSIPVDESSIMVSINNRILNFGDEYYIDFSFDPTILRLEPSVEAGRLAITLVGVGGIKYLSYDKKTITSSNVTSTISINLSSYLGDIGSTFVTFDGVPLESTQYTLGAVSSKNKRGKVTVKQSVLNYDSNSDHIIQVWTFGEKYKGYSQMYEETIVVSNEVDYIFSLEHPPGETGPLSSRMIVELNKKRLTPPSTYTHIADQIEDNFYDIDPTMKKIVISLDINGDPIPTPQPLGIFSLPFLEVHVNGVKLRKGIDFILDQPNDRIQIRSWLIKLGDIIEITQRVRSDYYIDENKNLIVNQLLMNPGDILKVITFNNHDSSLIHTQTFKSKESRRYKIDRIIFNDNYVWVSIGGNPLANGYDYYIEENTVVIGDHYPFVSTDKVVITSFTDRTDDEAIGYRIFKDILNRTHYKRLCKLNTAFLIEPLNINDTVIYVDNGSVLPVPNPSKNSPGIIWINGERIEYMQKDSGALRKIRRATLGTGAKDVYPKGTAVVDQARDQNVPYKDIVTKEVITATNTLSYVINTISFNTLTNYHDQVEVYYGGIPLHKPTPAEVTRIVHDSSITYDSEELTIEGQSGDTNLDPEFYIYNTEEGVILTLNLPIEIKSGVLITLINRKGEDWYDDDGSLLDDTSEQAIFLRERLSYLPDKYHYGQIDE